MLLRKKKSCIFATSWSRTRSEKPVDYQDVRGGFRHVPPSDNRKPLYFEGLLVLRFLKLLNAKLLFFFLISST